MVLNLAETEWFYHVPLDSPLNENVSDNCNQILKSYSIRPATLSNVSLYEFVRKYNYPTYSRKRRESIVRVYPKLQFDDR